MLLFQLLWDKNAESNKNVYVGLHKQLGDTPTSVTCQTHLVPEPLAADKRCQNLSKCCSNRKTLSLGSVNISFVCSTEKNEGYKKSLIIKLNVI